MDKDKSNYKTVDEYIKTFPENTQEILNKIRKVIKDVIPESLETISYRIPTYKLNGKNVIHFAAYSKHIGLYPGPLVVEHFGEKLKEYKVSKGTLQFQLDKPIPYDLIRDIVKYASKR